MNPDSRGNPLDIRALHDQAMDAAEAAQVARRQGKKPDVVALLESAWTLERQAAMMAVHANAPEPTRAILLQSAASLALQVKKTADAERLLATALAGEPPESIADDLRNLLEQVYLERHLSTKGLELGEEDIQLSVSGEEIGYGWAPADEVSRRVDVLQSLVFRTAERQARRPYRERGQAGPDIRSYFKAFLGVPKAASYCVVVKIARSKHQPELFRTPAAQVLEEMVDLLESFSTGDMRGIAKRVKNKEYRANFIGLAKQLGPNEAVRQVGLTIQRQGGDRSVAIRRERIAGDESARSKKRVVKSLTLTGVLRLADSRDLKKNRIVIVTDKHKEQHVAVPSGMMEDIVGPYWQQRVRVSGVQKGKGAIVLSDIAKA